MKRRVSCLLFVMMLAMLLPVMAVADSQYPYVTDSAQLLPDNQQNRLENRAQEIAEAYQCGVYIVTVDDYTDDSHYSNIARCAEDIFLENNLGYGTDRDGIMLMLSMSERDYALIVYGDFALSAFTDYGQERLENAFLDDFKFDDWTEGFEDFLSESEHLLNLAKSGTPLDVGKREGSVFGKLAVIVLVSCLIAGIVCGVLLGQMRTAVKGSHATQYIAEKGVHMRVRTDQFTHSTQIRRKIEPKTSSSGGTSVNSRGFSGRSGKF